MLRIWFACVLAVWPLVGVADVVGTVRVIDADTIDVGGTRIRLHAIDAPEMDQSCETEQGIAFACGRWVTAQVRARFDGAVARCVPRDIDRFDRIVAQCRVAEQDMGEIIVSEGWAFAYRRYGMDYDLTEKAALVTGRGLHGVRVQSPAQFRATKVSGSVPADPACVIKGNISKNGQIYHVPGQEYYTATRINLAKGERWFCSERDARAAGWRAARR
jgi:endonuclease YncB( thermonuclease family)